MNRPSLLVLMRHAQSERNKVKRGDVYFASDEARQAIRGIPDHKIALTAEGERQADETGPYIRERFGTFDYVYHSGYVRTHCTADRVLNAYPPEERARIKIRHNLFIRERDPGFAYDMTKAEAESHFPWLREYWDTFGGFLARPPGGESIADLVQRVYLFINMLFRDRVGEKILVVTHGGTIKGFRFLLEHWNYEQGLNQSKRDGSPKNCGVTVYEYDHEQKRLVLRDYNTVYWKPQEEEVSRGGVVLPRSDIAVPS